MILRPRGRWNFGLSLAGTGSPITPPAEEGDASAVIYDGANDFTDWPTSPVSVATSVLINRKSDNAYTLGCGAVNLNTAAIPLSEGLVGGLWSVTATQSEIRTITGSGPGVSVIGAGVAGMDVQGRFAIKPNVDGVGMTIQDTLAGSSMTFGRTNPNSNYLQADVTGWSTKSGGSADLSADEPYFWNTAPDVGFSNVRDPGTDGSKWFAPAPTGYTAQSVNLVGTTNWMAHSNPTGLVDTKVGVFSGWVNLLGGDGANQTLINNGGSPNFAVYRTNANRFEVVANPSTILMQSSNLYTAASGWVHLLAAWNVATGTAEMYINDAADRLASPTANDNLINYTTNNWALGRLAAAFWETNYDCADFYLNTDEFIDITVEASRRLFIDAAGKPVDLGSDGSTPTGTAPMFYQSGDPSLWHLNKGLGGGFTLSGPALTAGSSSPSD